MVENQTDPVKVQKLLSHYLKVAKDRGASLHLVMLRSDGKDFADSVCMIVPFDALLAIEWLNGAY